MNLEKLQNAENNPLEHLKNVIELVSQELYTELEKNFSDLEYHNPNHSIGVSKNTLFFLEETITSEENKLLAYIAGLGHDIDQSFSWQPAFSGVGFRRVRETGTIEASSSNTVLTLLTKNGMGLSQENIDMVNELIMGTVPAYSTELGTVIQPNITKKSRIETWALAASDLAQAGFNPQQFIKDGDDVFNEDRTIPELINLTDDQKIILRNEILNWNKSQITYAEGQKKYWNRTMVPQFIKNKLSKFDDSIKLCIDRYDRRVGMSLEELLSDMGFGRYKIDSDLS